MVGRGAAPAQWFGTFLPDCASTPPRRCSDSAGVRAMDAPRGHCDRLIGIDVAERCVEACRERFGTSDHMTFVLNDGLSLDAVDDDAVELAVSLDSLVHVEADVMQSYIEQLGRKLRPGGVAFLHHSNLGEYAYYQRLRKLRGATRVGWATGVVERNLQWRAFSVSAETVRGFAADAGLGCVSQELVNWGTRRALIDCFTVLVRNPSVSTTPAVLRNRAFMDEAQRVKQLDAMYRAR